MFNATAEALRKIPNNPQPPPLPLPRADCSRTVVGHDAIDDPIGARKLDVDLTRAVVEARMLCGIRDKFVDDQSELPATLRLECQTMALHCELYLQSVE